MINENAVFQEENHEEIQKDEEESNFKVSKNQNEELIFSKDIYNNEEYNENNELSIIIKKEEEGFIQDLEKDKIFKTITDTDTDIEQNEDVNKLISPTQQELDDEWVDLKLFFLIIAS
jgi:hypothetical protein